MAKTILFSDTNINDYETLLAGLGRDVEIHLLNVEEDGVLQIAAILQGRSGFDSIQILSHGSSGSLFLGSSVLNNDNLAGYSAVLSQIGSALSETGDLLLYGCNVAQGEAGLRFIDSLAQYTGADVAASNDLTGQGGNWLLEAANGQIEAALAVNETSQYQYAGTLSINSAPTFGAGDGMVVTNASNSYYSFTMQADGKILLGGTNALVRYNSDGSLDTSFDSDGKVTTDMLNGDTVTVQADGKILLCGYDSLSPDGNGHLTLALVRYNSNGSLDTSFDSDGKVTTDMTSRDTVTVQADGKILLSGSRNDDFALIRFNSNGSLDTSFDSDGKVTIPSYDSYFFSGDTVTVQADGKILMGGRSDNNDTGGYDLALARYNSNGSLDTSFGIEGRVTTDVYRGGDESSTVTVQTDGKILLGVSRSQGGPSNDGFVLVRYNSNGSLDTSFSDDGKVTTDLGGYFLYGAPVTVTVQADGKILMGWVKYNSFSDDYGDEIVDSDFVLVRYNSNGSLDTSFDGDGKVTTDTGSDINLGLTGDTIRLLASVAVQADGKILMGGSLALVRYNSDGSLDSTFDAVNTLNGTPTYTENGSAVVLDSTVQIYDAELAAQGHYAGASITLARHGGANSQDVFSGSGNLTGSGSNALLSGITIGTVSNSNGALTLSFNSNANQARVNEALSSLAYSNKSDYPPASVQIDWTFNDGNAGAQGSGGALTALGSTKVNIIAVNELPTGTVTITGVASQGQTLHASNSLADLDGLGAITYQWKANGIAIGTGDSFALTQTEVGKIITVKASYTDGFGKLEAKTSAATAVVLNINDLPTGAVKISGIVKQGEVLTASNTLADADGLGPVNYQWKANGIDVGAGGSYKLTKADVNKAITVTASYTDNGNKAESVSSLATAVVAKNFTDLEIYGDNGGSKADVLTGMSGNDSLYGLNMNDDLSGDEGNDSLYGGYGNDSLHGGDGNDKLYGEQGDDYMEGGAGNDRLDGGLGIDTMKGGAGNDVYYLGYDEIDVIQDNGLATDIDTVIIPYQLSTYVLPANVEIGTLTTGTQDSDLTGNGLNNTLTGNNGDNELKGGAGQDILFGNSGIDILFGDSDNDTLNAGLGNDILNGGAGADKLIGGSGNDVYVVDNGGDVVTETSTLATEIDKITSSINYTLGANLENLTLTGTAANGTGNGLANTLTGNAGANTLNGGAGADKLIGGAGNDGYVVDNAGDVVTETSTLATEIDKVSSSINYTLGANLENLTLTGTAANGTGNGLANSLTGNAAANTLNGGTGADKLIGGSGNDVYVVDNSGDVVTETSTLVTEIDKVSSSINYTLGANLENLILTGTAANGTGNGLANMLTGNVGNNTLNGGAGADSLFGGSGNDVYVVDNSGDVVTETSILATEIDKVNSSINYTLGANLENLTLMGTAAKGTGNGLANTLTGNSGANNLNGSAGNDSLIGGLGKDNLTGGLGADKFKFNAVAETGNTVTTRDIIADFKHNQGDKIDLSAIDANTAFTGNNAFSALKLGGTFSGVFANPGELYFDQSAHILYGNNDADSTADFSIQLTGVNSLAAADLLL